VKKLNYALLILVFGVSAAQAKVYPKLTRFVDENVTQIQGALGAAAASEPMELGGKFEFKRILLRLQAKAGFSIDLATLELIPEVELVFQKEKKI